MSSSRIIKLPFGSGTVTDKSNIKKDFRKALVIIFLAGISALIATLILYFLYPV